MHTVFRSDSAPAKARRVRVKMCGFTREEDVDAAVATGADAIGFVLYEQSPRYVTPERAAQLAGRLPPFVQPVLLFVNAHAASIHAALAHLPHALVQLHGDEPPDFAASLGHPYIKAARVPLDANEPFDLTQFCQDFSGAQAVLLDAKVPNFGGAGLAFDWSRIPPQLPQHLIVSAGLTEATVAEAINRFACTGYSLAVDVSSGIERAKGVKDVEKMRAFMRSVHNAVV